MSVHTIHYSLKHFFCLFLICYCSIFSDAQITIDASQKEQMQAKYGVTEQELQSRLALKGVDLNSVDTNDPNEMIHVQTIIEETLHELELENQNSRIISEQPQTNNSALDSAKVSIQKIAKQETLSDDSLQIKTQSEKIPINNMGASDTISKSYIYGQHLFQEKKVAYFDTPSQLVRPPYNYRIDASDIINVSIWGLSNVDFNLEVHKDGYVYPSGLARIFLKGYPFEKVKSQLIAKLGNYYRFKPQEIEISLQYSRNINVNIFGEANKVGSINLPAINTAINALVAAEGLTKLGSVRKIELKHGNETKLLDLYAFIKNPSVQYDFFLQDNDLIYIPLSERLVTITGAVKRPSTFELIENEGITELLEFAGGFNSNAYKGSIQIIRLENDEQKILDFDASNLSNLTSLKLMDGDQILVRNIEKKYENYVNIEGAVEFPGQFSIQNSMRVSDLLLKAKLDKKAKKDIGFLIRKNPDNTSKFIRLNFEEIAKDLNTTSNYLLQNEDRIITYQSADFSDAKTISVLGGVRNPNEYAYSDDKSLRVQDLILLGGGLDPSALPNAYIKRVNPTNKRQIQYIRVNVMEAMLRPNDENNPLLEANDNLIIYTKEAFSDELSLNLTISGAVRQPGDFQFARNMSVADLIYMAKGTRKDAADFAYIKRHKKENPKDIEYIRVWLNNKSNTENILSAENAILQPKDNIIVYSKQTYSDEFFVTINGAIRQPGQFEYSDGMTITDAIRLSGGLTFNASNNRIDVARIIFQENQPTKTIVTTVAVDSNYLITDNDFLLLPFDQIEVRSVPSYELQQTVLLEGEFVYPGVYALINKNETLSSVIKRAGGLTNEAFPQGAVLDRKEDQPGLVITQLAKALDKPKTKYDFILKNGDVLSVPKNKELVSIHLDATLANQILSEDLVEKGIINVSYRAGKRANWYLKEYAGGISRKNRARKRFISVSYPNGHKKIVRHGLWAPKVKKGSSILVGKKSEKSKDDTPKAPKEPVNWEKITSTTLSLVSTVLTIAILVQRL